MPVDRALASTITLLHAAAFYVAAAVGARVLTLLGYRASPAS